MVLGCALCLMRTSSHHKRNCVTIGVIHLLHVTSNFNSNLHSRHQDLQLLQQKFSMSMIFTLGPCCPDPRQACIDHFLERSPASRDNGFSGRILEQQSLIFRYLYGQRHPSRFDYITVGIPVEGTFDPVSYQRYQRSCCDLLISAEKVFFCR